MRMAPLPPNFEFPSPRHEPTGDVPATIAFIFLLTCDAVLPIENCLSEELKTLFPIENSIPKHLHYFEKSCDDRIDKAANCKVRMTKFAI